MSENIKPCFKLNLRRGAFPFRLMIASILGVGATAFIFDHQPNLFSFSMVMLSALISIAVFYIIYPMVRKFQVAWGVILSWVACILVTGLVYISQPWLENQMLGFIFGTINSDITRIYLGVLGLFVVPIALSMEQLLLTQSEVTTLIKESEVSDLDFRIRPHFLFNSLNNVASLISIDPEKAEDGLLDLADMFRVILTDKRKLVPFSAEYEMAMKYMNLEKMRLGDRLQDEWKIENIDHDTLLPILTLQPLIENSIYHGIETRLDGGKVTIRAKQSNNNLYVSVVNPKPDFIKPSSKGNQIAQENLVNRFKYLYNNQAVIKQVETDSFYTVTIKVPLKIGNNNIYT